MNVRLGDDSLVNERSVILAKAGGAAETQENSLAAIQATASLARAAVHYRVALEVDVRCSADGHLVLHHDATLERTTSGTGPIAARRLEELRALTAGNGGPLVTLAEAWENIPELETIVELHDAAPQTLRALRLWLGGLSSSERARIVIASERTPATVAVRAMKLGVRTSATLPEGLGLLAHFYLGLPKPSGHVWMLPEKFLGLSLLQPALLGAAKSSGDSVWAWVIDEAEKAQALFRHGVDGVFTTRPAALLAELEAMQASRS
jgi:glycerophosphoryl diester phosphodiesterase